MKVFVYSARPYDQPILQSLAGAHELLFTEKRLSEETAHYADGCDAVALFTSDDGSASVLTRLHACGVRYLLLRSVGFDHVNLSKAALLRMRVANVPEYSPYAVAEHGVALLLALNRQLLRGQHLMAIQDFRIDSLKGFDIHGKSVGVVGTGKIGMAFAKIMLGFGAKVLASDPIVNPDAIDVGVNYVSLEQLLRQSDIVSLHCPLNASTRYMMSSERFNLMKKGAILVNTSRGAIVNTMDLIDALDRGQVGGACLDVYESEKGLFFEDHRNEIIRDARFSRLRSFPNVIITAHQGFLTSDAIDEIANTTIFNANCFDCKQPCPNELILTEACEGTQTNSAKQSYRNEGRLNSPSLTPL